MLVGVRVRISGLKARADLNGHVGVVLNCPSSNGRLAVRCGSESVLIREANVSLLATFDNLPVECVELVLEHLRCLNSTIALVCAARQPYELTTTWLLRQTKLTYRATNGPGRAPMPAAIADLVAELPGLERLQLEGSASGSVDIAWLRSTLKMADFKVDLSPLFRNARSYAPRFIACAIAAAHMLPATHVELFCLERGRPFRRIVHESGIGFCAGENKYFVSNRVVAEAELGLMMDAAFELAHLWRDGDLTLATEHITATSQGFGCDGVAAFATSMRHMTYLSVLRLNNNLIGDDGACTIAARLGDVPNLQELGLAQNPIGDRGIAAIADAIGAHQIFRPKHALSARLHEAIIANPNHPLNHWDPANPKYEPPTSGQWSRASLDLNGCQHDEVGLIALARAIRSGGCRDLKRLSLGGPKVSDRGVAALCEGLCLGAGELSGLSHLHLSTPPYDPGLVGVEGCAALAKALSSAGALPRLEELTLEGRLSKESAAGCMAVAAARPAATVTSACFMEWRVAWPRHQE